MDFLPFNLASEQLIPAKEAIRLIPPGRNSRGKHITMQTLIRWMCEGYVPRNAPPGFTPIRLEGCKLGDQIVTSQQSIQRFAERCSSGGKVRRPETVRSAEHERACAELKAAGF